MQRHESVLKPLAGCEGCKKICIFKGRVAIEEGNEQKFGCNTSKDGSK